MVFLGMVLNCLWFYIFEVVVGLKWGLKRGTALRSISLCFWASDTVYVEERGKKAGRQDMFPSGAKAICPLVAKATWLLVCAYMREGERGKREKVEDFRKVIS